MGKGLYKFYEYCGRMGELEGLGVYDSSDVEKCMGQTANFGEVLGKHSDISVEITSENFKLISNDPTIVSIFEEHVGHVGQDPIGQILDEMEDGDND